MSQFKCFQITRAPLAECRQNNSAYCKIFLAQYIRYSEQLNHVLGELSDLGAEAKLDFPTPQKIESRIEKIFANHSAGGLEAFNYVLEQKIQVEKQIDEQQARLQKLIADFQKRYRLVRDRAETAAQMRSALSELLKQIPAS
ncbi:MAG: hypothetical protein M3Y82_07640, partial [Verrucomicrobiota bacterium]|nr:hypothetical protein [Verrucomicrobiota bacterium]